MSLERTHAEIFRELQGLSKMILGLRVVIALGLGGHFTKKMQRVGFISPFLVCTRQLYRTLSKLIRVVNGARQKTAVSKPNNKNRLPSHPLHCGCLCHSLLEQRNCFGKAA